jgi:hypothetical protein
VLRVRERTSTPSVDSTFRFAFESLKECGGASLSFMDLVLLNHEPNVRVVTIILHSILDFILGIK